MNRLATLIAAAAVILASCALSWAQSGPFVFAYGLQGDGAAEVAVAVGLNTLYLEVPPRYDSMLPDIRSQIAAAGRAGLKVIVALPTIPPGSVAMAADDPDLTAYAWKTARQIVSVLKDEPALAGWAVGDYVEDRIRYTDTGLIQYLQQRYGRLEALNAAWGTAFGAWTQITITQATTLDDEQPFGVARPSIDLADYQREAFATVLELWARQVRSADADTPLFTGRIGLYRCLTAVPDSYDFVVPAISPDELELDKLAHNVHAIDIARQAGRFQVVRALRVPVPGEPTYSKDALQRWINQAALHGAVGIGLDNYGRLVASGLLPGAAGQESPTALANRRTLAEIIRPALQRYIFTVTPKPAAAFLYEPYAEGYRVGELSVYGYIADFSDGEPDYLFNTFRCGSRFGLVDYLTVAALEDPEVDLQQYSFIAAPLALDLPAAATTRLCEYVRGGGAIVADLGAGLRQSGSWQRLPRELQLLFGIEQMPILREEVGDFSFGAASEYFPSLPPPLQSQGSFRLSEHLKQGTPAQRR
ncbi:MAG: beta-galactosidase, partial [Armatimonadetes bacterium]|nr:beta-galactosidase [Armatimonadota bacterium]